MKIVMVLGRRLEPLGELTPEQRVKALWALALLMVIVVIGGVALMVFRRHLTQADAADKSANVGFSLAELRAMRDRGEITAEEYELTRARVVAKVKARIDQPPPEKPDAPEHG